MDKRAKPFVGMFRKAADQFGIPAAYLYVLSGRESRWCPTKIAGVKGCPESPSSVTDVQVRTKAVGLFQLTKAVVTDFNEKHGTTYTKRDTLNPQVNITIGAWYLAKIHANLLPISWDSEREVALFTQAWNSGPYAAAKLYTAGTDVDRIKAHAERILAAGEPYKGYQAKTYKWFATRKTTWAKNIASDYMKARAPDFLEPPLDDRPAGGCCHC